MPSTTNGKGKPPTTTHQAGAPKRPTTLKEAHELMMRVRPRQDAPPAVWLEYRQRSAELYAQIADIDRFHHHEARYWAELEGEIARNLAAQIVAEKTAATRKGGKGDGNGSGLGAADRTAAGT